MRSRPSIDDADFFSEQNKSSDVLEEFTDAVNKAKSTLKSSSLWKDYLNKYKDIQSKEIEVVNKNLTELKFIREIVETAVSKKSVAMKATQFQTAFNLAVACYLINHKIPQDLNERTTFANALSSYFFYGKHYYTVLTKDSGPVTETTRWEVFKSFFRNLDFWNLKHKFGSSIYRQQEIPDLSLALRNVLRAAADAKKLPLKLFQKIECYHQEQDDKKKEKLLRQIRNLSNYCTLTMQDKNGNTPLDLAKKLDEDKLVDLLTKAAKKRAKLKEGSFWSEEEENLNFRSPTGDNFKRKKVLGDGECGYRAIDTTRAEAHKLLNDNLRLIQDLLKPAIKDLLLTETFINYLKTKGVESKALNKDFKNYQSKAQHGKKSEVDKATNKLYQHADKDLTLTAAFIDYDLLDKQADGGWAHICVLQALAHLNAIELHIWRIKSEKEDELIPDSQYGFYKPPNPKKRLDLLFVANNHFDQLELLSELSSDDQDSVIIPMKLGK